MILFDYSNPGVAKQFVSRRTPGRYYNQDPHDLEYRIITTAVQEYDLALASERTKAMAKIIHKPRKRGATVKHNMRTRLYAVNSLKPGGYGTRPPRRTATHSHTFLGKPTFKF